MEQEKKKVLMQMIKEIENDKIIDFLIALIQSFNKKWSA